MVSEHLKNGTLCEIQCENYHEYNGQLVIIRGREYPHGDCQYIVEKLNTDNSYTFSTGYPCILVSNNNLVLA